MAEVDELTFRAMGSAVQIVVVDGSPGLADAGRRRIEDLDRRWSRVLPDSEISQLNEHAGEPIEVSDDTIALIARAVDAWRFTGGAFDTTVVGAVMFTDIEIAGNVVVIPQGSGLDPGGLGRGLAADLVAAELQRAGAAGVCVNVGGDVRVIGAGPDGTGWTVALEHPWLAHALVHVGVADGAVATCTTLARRGSVDGSAPQHLIDPRTGKPADTDLNLVTVIAGNAWAAEVLAKALLIRGSAHPFELVDGAGAEVLVVREDGAVTVSQGFGWFCRTKTLPAFVRPES